MFYLASGELKAVYFFIYIIQSRPT